MKSFLAFFAFLAAVPIQAQWKQTNGPGGGAVHAIAEGDSALLVGTTESGVFRSLNSGITWTSSNPGLPTLQVTQLACLGKHAFVGTRGEGMFRSTNDGVTWTSVNEIPFGYIHDLRVAGSTVYVGGSGGIFCSTDSGSSWIDKTSDLYYQEVTRIGISSSTLVAVNRWNPSIFLSTNMGTNWISITAGLPNDFFLSVLLTETKIFLSTFDHGVYLSPNNGQSWIPINSGLTTNRIFFVGLNGTNILAGTDSGAFISTNDGTSWTSLGLHNQTVSSIKKVGTDFIAATGSGIFRSTDNGITWLTSNTGLAASYVTELISIETNIVAISEGEVFHSGDDGETWFPIDSSQIDGAISGFATGRDRVFAFGEYGVFRSSNNGVSWSLIPLPTTTCMTSRDSIICAGTELGFWKSSNNGNSWHLRDLDYKGGTSICIVNSTFFTCDGSQVLRSWDDGFNWEPLDLDREISTIWSYQESIFGILRYPERGLLRSTDLGTTWVDSDSGLPTSSVRRIAKGGIHFFAATEDHGVFLSSDNGSTWAPANEGLLNQYLKCIATNNHDIVVGTVGGGVWRRPLLDFVTSTNEDLTNPSVVILQQNYPNPFNPSTTITFHLPNASLVKLSVYDILGQHIVTLIDGMKDAGFTSVSLDARNFSSGTYFYTLRTGDFTETRRMVLLR